MFPLLLTCFNQLSPGERDSEPFLCELELSKSNPCALPIRFMATLSQLYAKPVTKANLGCIPWSCWAVPPGCRELGKASSLLPSLVCKVALRAGSVLLALQDPC